MTSRAERAGPGNTTSGTGARSQRTRPTMRDVAAAAGVDASTVSRALNPATRLKVNAATADRVLASATELGYRMNSVAKGLRLNTTMAIGMVIPDVSNPFFPPVVRGVEDVLAPAGRSLILMNTDDDQAREADAIDQLVQRHVDALLLATSYLRDPGPDTGGTPCVLVNRTSRDRSVPSVAPDDRQGIRLAVKHLVRLGHERVIHVAAPQDTSTGLVRRHEFERACAEFHVSGRVHQATAFTQEAGRQAGTEIFAGDVPTAVIAANDLMAIGLLQAAAASGLRVPDDLSMVGYDDVPLVDLLNPPLTTVRVPQYQMGREAARIVLAMTAPGSVGSLANSHVRLSPKLVVRQTTAPPVAGQMISDALWARMAPLLQPATAGGGRWRDHRQVLEAIAWRSRTGRPWRDVPSRFGPWQTAWKRLDRWSKDGTWGRLRQAVAGEPGLAGEADWLQAAPSERQRDTPLAL